MKRTILFLFVTMFSVVTICAQEAKTITYVVNGKKVENFDGTQLVGKTISSYTISQEGDVHAIFTSDYEAETGKIGKVMIFSGKADVKTGEKVNAEDRIVRVRTENNILNVLDGKIVTQTELQKLSPSQIESITIIKDKNDPEFIKYSNQIGEEPSGIIIFKTKK